MLGSYGSLGVQMDTAAKGLIERVATDSQASARGWCVGRSMTRTFVAQLFVGHQATRTGAHIQAYWQLDSLAYLSLVAAADSDSMDTVIRIVESVEVPTANH